jgi:multiple antibiotic resistance protein
MSLTAFLTAIPVAFMALLPVINPVGDAIVLSSLTRGIDAHTHRQLARRVAINTTGLLFALLLTGRYILALFGVSVPVVQVAGGIVLAALGWRLLHQEATSTPVPQSQAGPPADVLSQAFYPFTFPITVGPGSIAVVLTLAAHLSEPHLIPNLVMHGAIAVAILGNAALVYVCIAYSNRIINRLGPETIATASRIIAFFVVCIGAQICWEGASALIATLRADGSHVA